MRLICLFVFAVTTLAACDPAALVGPRYANAGKMQKSASFHQGVCFGQCPVYTLDVYPNGLLVYRGERFTERPGIWEKSIDRRRVTGLLDSLRRADLGQYPRSFKSRLPDMSSTTLTAYGDDGVATPVSFKEEAPGELKALAASFKALAAGDGWRQVSEALEDGKQVPGINDREEIIVQLKEGEDAGAWVGKYGKQDVRLVRRINPNGQYYLITSNPNLMGADELLKFLRRDAAVVSAQLNQRVELRQE